MKGGHVRTRWWRAPRVRALLATVLVLNVALGLAMSIIGLRHQADADARLEPRLAWQVAAIGEARSELWRSVTAGRVSPALARVQADQLSADGGAAAAALAEDVGTARDQIARGDLAAARLTAADVDERAADLTADLRERSTTQLEETRHASLVADVETVLLMVFAAVMGLVLVRRTIAVRLHAEQQRVADQRRSEARFASLVQQSSDVISIVGTDSRIGFQTPSVRRVLGYDPQALVGTALLDLVHPDDRYQVVSAHESLASGDRSRTSTVRLRAADGTWRHVESVHTDMRDEDGVDGFVVTSRDVSERVVLEEQLRHSALHDDLTGLANRSLFLDRVEHALARRVDDASTTVIFLDIDDFKGVNDALGHTAGDGLLVELARRLAGAARDQDTVARLGGDEFAVLLESTDPGELDSLLDRMQHEVRRPLFVDGRELHATASVGVAEAAADTSAAALLANADLAMYAAKGAGKDTMVRFSATMSVDAERRLELKTDLQRALREGRIRPWFQPTVDLGSEAIIGFEALARWEHPEHGLIPPLEFIPLAEQTGQIVEIGRSILHQACQALSLWDRTHPAARDLTMSVNLSARELAEPSLVEHVLAAVSEADLDPGRLTIEVTESLWVSDRGRATAQLTELRAAGVRVAIDDFGTGYSSLGYLEKLPVDVVKIDKSFVDRVTEQQPGLIVETIATLTHALGLVSVAEGIEQEFQASALRRLGCDVGQGYLFSRPRPAEDVPGLLDRELRPDDPDHPDDAPRAA